MLELAVVIPTFNENSNIVALIEKLDKVLGAIEWEAVVVDDDSKDGTADTVRRIARGRSNIRIVHRVGRRGLSSACIEGMLATAAPYLAVMDADLQHDETILPAMLQLIRQDNLDLVIGSRNVSGGSMGEFAASRQTISNLGKYLSRVVCKCELTDPMSGFFMVRREYLELVVRRLSGLGFKILVDLIASSPRPVRLREIPYTFGKRLHGESKLDSMVLLEYVFLILDKTFGHIVPVRFLMFTMAGLTGAIVHIAFLAGLYRTGTTSFATAQVIGIAAAMTVNFLVNNWTTYRDRRLKGWNVLWGLLTFYVACSAGAVINYALATFCYSNGLPWYISALVGLGVGSVWNYGITSLFSWRSQLPRQNDSQVRGLKVNS